MNRMYEWEYQVVQDNTLQLVPQDLHNNFKDAIVITRVC